MDKFRQFLNSVTAKNLGQFIGIWILLFAFLIAIGIITTASNWLDWGLVTFAITVLINVGYSMGYDKGVKEARTK